MEDFYAYRSFWQEKGTITRFAQFGVNTVCIYPAHTLCSLGVPYCQYPPTWIGPDCYDFKSLDQQIQDIIDANGQARILSLIDLNTPEWWTKHYSNKYGYDSFYRLGQVVADQKWRSDTGAYLQAFLRHCKQQFPDHMAGYILSCGGTCEWQDYTLGQESVSRAKAWREWMIERGKDDPVDIPPQSIRDHVTHDLLRDPQQDGLAIDYWRFTQELIGETILYFATAAQEVLDHEVPLGVYYGYILELAQGRLVSEGHLDYDRVFASADLDFFLAPATYHDRGNGGASGTLMPLGTVQRHGKKYLHEIDHRTHTACLEPGKAKNMMPLSPMDQWQDTQESIAGLRREFALCLIQKASLWWFDMFGHWYDGPEVADAMEQMARLWGQYRNIADEPASQVALIADPNSALYIDQADPRVNMLYYNLRAELGRIGTPYSCFSVSDIPHVDWSDYRLIVLPALYVLDDHLHHILREFLLNSNRTIIWGDRPGVINNQEYDLENVQSLTGCRFDPKSIVTCNHDNWHSVLAPSAAITQSTLRNYARQAGVHIYSQEIEPLFASGHFLAIHSALGGRRKVALPRKTHLVRELFSGEVVAKDASEFEDDLAGPGTVLYYLD